jgi:8-oxo-dGTP pyrophosphatase MutT (NUDIX family)
VEPGETIEDAAKRELLEESSVVATTLAKRGDLTFTLISYAHIMVSQSSHCCNCMHAPVAHISSESV